MHRTEYCLSVCLIPIPSMAYCLWWQDPLVHLRPCLDSASVRSRESLVAITAIPLAPISKMCGGICSLCQETTQLVQVWSEKSFLSFSKRFLVAICRAQQRAGCKCIWERFVWNPLQASTVEHSWITLAYHIPAAWVCPETRDTVAEDACNIASHLSIDRTHDKRGIFRQSWSRHVGEPPKLFKCEVRSPSSLLSKSFLNAICRTQQRAASVYEKDLFEPLYKQVLWNIHESPWVMVPTPAALVCPDTCETVAEDTCNIASHLSIDGTHDKQGILRQTRYIQAVLKQTFQRTARKFSHPSRASHLLVYLPAWHMEQIYQDTFTAAWRTRTY